jgi:type II secretory pathway pseudopilin PulG
MNRFRNNKGITLVELIVAMLVFTVITTAVASVFAPMLMGFRRVNEMAEINAILDNVAIIILNDIHSAVRIEPAESNSNVASLNIFYDDPFNDDFDFDSDDLPLPNVEYRIDANIIMRLTPRSIPPSELPIFDENFYRNNTVSFRWEVDDGLFILTVTIDHLDGWQRTRTYTARPLGLMP